MKLLRSQWSLTTHVPVTVPRSGPAHTWPLFILTPYLREYIWSQSVLLTTLSTTWCSLDSRSPSWVVCPHPVATQLKQWWIDISVLHLSCRFTGGQCTSLLGEVADHLEEDTLESCEVEAGAASEERCRSGTRWSLDELRWSPPTSPPPHPLCCLCPSHLEPRSIVLHPMMPPIYWK